MEDKLQVRIIPRMLTIRLMRQRRQMALWMKKLPLLEKASKSILPDLLLLKFVLHLHLSLVFLFFFLIFSILQVSLRSTF